MRARARREGPAQYDKAPVADEALRTQVRALAMPAIVAGYEIHEKHDRYGALSEVKKDAIAELKEELGDGLHAARSRSRPRRSSRTSSTTTCASSP